MPTFSLGELATASGGALLRGNAEAFVASFSIDTRSLRPGGVFFAGAPGTHTAYIEPGWW